MKEKCTKDEAECIVNTYANMVYRFAVSLTKNKDQADDVFQNVFLRYSKTLPVFENEEHAKAWFFTVTRNCCRSYLTTAFLRYHVPLEMDIPIEQKEENALYYYVMKLPVNYRMVIHLFYYEQMTTKQIGDILHKKDATIRTWLKRAREQLKTMLEGCDIDEIL